jgi:sodium-dependent dicarboxylate transporter 2/3/5
MNNFDLKRIFLYLGLALLGGTFIYQSFGEQNKLFAMFAVALTVAVWWIFEVLPLAVTALLPVIAYPFLGIMSTKKVAPVYMSSVLLLFIGGFFVAMAMRRWNLHKRIALTIISFFGNKPENLIAGFMVATASLSMWISNTATTVMMVSIGLAVIKSYEDIEGESDTSFRFGSALMMSIAYSATIGGMATLVGTPPNIAFIRIFGMNFPEMEEVSFAAWFSFGLPLVMILLFLAKSVIVRLMIRGSNIKSIDESIITEEKEKLGPIKYEEKWVLFVFFSLAALWIFRKDLQLGFMKIPGWSNLLTYPQLVDDGTVAILMAMILFMIPSKTSTVKKRILEVNAVSEIPWHTILLFGGGFALAKGIQDSGLSAFIGEKLIYLQDVNTNLIVIALTAGMSFFTELASNMASTEMALPILASISKTTGINPFTLMIPATLAASSAFMLPAATAPNAIIFGSDRVRIKDMVRVGFWINLTNIIFVSIFSLYVIPFLMS